MSHFWNAIFKAFFIYSVMLYRYFISPFLGVSCRFQPTCSEYTIDAIKTFGVIKGLFYSCLRVIKCNPFGSHGFDPVPHNQGKDTCQINKD